MGSMGLSGGVVSFQRFAGGSLYKKPVFTGWPGFCRQARGIALMGACMALVGVSIALIQGELRRLLSYHIISQVGYMVAGVGLGLASSVRWRAFARG